MTLHCSLKKVKNPHFAAIPVGTAPFGAPWLGIFPHEDRDRDKSPPVGGSGMGQDPVYMKRSYYPY